MLASSSASSAVGSFFFTGESAASSSRRFFASSSSFALCSRASCSANSSTAAPCLLRSASASASAALATLSGNSVIFASSTSDVSSPSGVPRRTYVLFFRTSTLTVRPRPAAPPVFRVESVRRFNVIFLGATSSSPWLFFRNASSVSFSSSNMTSSDTRWGSPASPI